MPESRSVLEFIFRANDQVTTVMERMSKSTDRFSSDLTKIAAPISSITTSVLQVEAAVAALSAGFLIFSTTRAAAVQSALVDLDKVLGDLDPSLDALKKQAFDISLEFGETAENVVNAAAGFKQSGFEADEALTLTRDALTAVGVSELTAAEAGELFKRAIAGFKGEAEDGARILDIANAVSNKYNTTVGQLLETLALCAPVANKANLSYEETAAIVTVMNEVFQDSAKASTSFNTSILRLISDNPKVVATLKDLEVSQRDANLQLRSGGDILLDVQRAFQRLPEAQQLATAATLVGTEQAAKFVEVLAQLNRTLEITEVANGAAGSAQAEFAKNLENAEFNAQRALNAFDLFSIKLGDQFLVAVNDASKGAFDLGKTLGDLVDSGSLDGLIDRLEPQVKKFGELLSGLASALPQALGRVDTSALEAQLDSLFVSISEVFDGLDLTKPDDLVKALQAVADGVANLIAFNRGLLDGFKPVLTTIGALIDLFTELNPEVVKIAAETAQWIINLTLLAGTLKTAGIALRGISSLLSGGTGLLKLLQQNGTAVSVLAKGPGSFLALASGAFAVGQAIGTLLQTWEPLNKLLERFTNDVGFLVKEFFPKFHDRLLGFDDDQKRVAESTDVARLALSAHGQTVSEVTDRIRNLTEKTAENAQANQVLTFRVQGAAAKYDNLFTSVIQANKGVAGSLEIWDKFTSQLIKSDDQIIDVVTSFKALDGSISDVGATTQAVLPKTVEEAIKLQQSAANIRLEFEKLEQSERVLKFELQADFQLEKLRQQGEQAKQLFESVNTAIESTGETLTGLLSLFNDARGFAKSDIFKLVKREDERREKLFEQQALALEAQIKFLNAQTRRLDSNEALIRVDAGTLAPELGALFNEVLRRAQISGNQEAIDILFGQVVLTS